jgi:hypothetical protein
VKHRRIVSTAIGNLQIFYRISTLAAPFPVFRVPVRVDLVSGAARIYCDDAGPHHITFLNALRKFSDRKA